MTSRFGFLLSSFLLTGVFVFVHPLSAAVTTSYDGCFMRNQDNDVATLWLKAPVCTITITNTDSTENTEYFTVKNLDPDLYTVTDENGTALSTTDEANTISFATTIEPFDTKTLTVSPWDYDASTSDFWFTAISDNQPESNGGETPNPIFIDLMNEINLLHSPFMTDSGDLIRGDTDDAGEHEQEYVLLDEVFRSYEGTTFTIPGDHDARSDLDAYYSAYFGARDYTFTYGNTSFVAFNTTEDLLNEGALTEDQMEWVESALAAATGEHLIVLMHHPLVTPDWANSDGFVDLQQAQQLAEWFVHYGVELVITGEVHGYDYSYIDEDDFPGIGGGFYQLINGGAGGSIQTYDGEHFFTLIHVSDDGIEHQRVDQSTVDLQVDYESQNDGTETEIDVSVYNSGSVRIPSVRVKANLLASERIYASTSDGQFYDVTSAETNGIRHGYFTLDLDAGALLDFTVKEQREIIAGVENTVDTDGVITFTTLPTAGMTATNLSVERADQPTTVEIIAWDEEAESREFRETTTASSSTTFSITELESSRQYNVYANEELYDRVASDSSGVLSFSFDGKVETRNYRIEIENDLVQNAIGAIPASMGGPNFRLYRGSSEALYTFFTYDSALTTGIQSLWIDMDGDRTFELATVPDAGTSGHVRLFTESGTAIDDLFPFGESFRGGVNLAAADVDADGDQELIVAPQSEHDPTVKIYRLKNGTLELLDRVNPFADDYRGGVNMTAGDLNGDGDDELVVGARSEKGVMHIYRWNHANGEMRWWFGKRPYVRTHSNSQNGLSLAMGDVNFDGADDIVVGSYTGNSVVRVFRYAPGKRTVRLISRRRVFGRDASGGVRILVGNINSTPEEEVIVTAHAGTPDAARVRTFNASAERMTALGGVKPFGSGATDGLNSALADVDGDFRMELVVSREASSNRIHVYTKRSEGFERLDAFAVYDDGFTGGIRLTQ